MTTPVQSGAGSDTNRRAGAGEAFCPACERFIGPALACPYCGCDGARAPLLLALRAGALAAALAGLALLYLAARNRDAPLVAVRDLTPTMNFAIVRVAGAVPRDPYVSRRGGSVDYASFLVADGTGVIRVAADERVARRLAAESRLPARGARVEVTARVGLSADGGIKLRLLAPDHLRQAPEGAGKREARPGDDRGRRQAGIGHS